MTRTRLFTAVAACSALLAFSTMLSAAGKPGTHGVRVDPADLGKLQSLGLEAGRAVDYGSFIWLELDQDELDLLDQRQVRLTVERDFGTIVVPGYRFDPVVDGEPEIALSRRETATGPRLRLVQLTGPTRGEWLDGLGQSGLKVLQYYPHHTYLVWGDVSTVTRASGSFVRWTGPFHPAYKVDARLAARTGRISNVDVMFYNDGDVDGTLARLEALGATILTHHPSQPDRAFFDAIVQVDREALEAISTIPTVLWLGYESPRPTLDDEMSSQIVAGNHPGGTPVIGYEAWLAGTGVDGAPVTWAVIDTGVDYDHPDLNTHIVGGYSFPGACNTNPGDDCAGGGHGTHVAGIIGGDAAAGFTDGNGFLYGLGMAPEYGIFAMNSLSGGSWPPTGGWQEHSKRAVLGGAIGGNNSWTTGEGTQHGYQASERTHDLMVRDGNFDTAATAEPFIEVFSAGNSGGSGLTAPKEAKNLIVTASSQNFRTSGNIDAISGFSSRGPAVDGRWVPTIAAPGEDIASARNDLGGSCSTAIGGTNNLYAFCSGTSMAAPHVAGAIVLLTEWWRDFNGGADPSPAMAKALLVNEAVDMGTADIPNIEEGWGRIHLGSILDPGSPILREFVDQTEVLGGTGDSYEITVGIPDTNSPLRVSVAWSDAPGAVGANPALVNNLDLTVETGGNTYLGNVFAGGTSVTGGSADVLNNLENVFVAAPGGSATITIDATNIAGDGIPYNPDTTDQDFALVCQNCALVPDYTLDVTPGSIGVCQPDDAVYTVDVGSILGYTDNVTLGTSGEPAGTSVGFSVNPVTPPGSSVLTISGIGGATPGSYSFDVTGTSTSGPKSETVDLDIFSLAPSAISLTSPADGATNVSREPTFEWAAAAEGGTYSIEIATDPTFSNVVESASDLPDTSYTSQTTLASGTVHYWRVAGNNTCGTGPWSATWSFTTVPAPGDCLPGDPLLETFFDDFEGGAGDWTSSGTGNTWTISSAQTHSGTNAFHAEDVPSVSDQYLVSPEIELPTGSLPQSLKFWNRQTIEDNGATACYDGAVLEISDDGGSTWVRLESELLTDPYDGPIDDGFSNPLQNENAWCGDPQDWLESIVDISAWAGETVEFRFRLATDSSVGREGWYIDDVTVQACGGDIFSDGFESGDVSAWSSTSP